MSGSEQKPRGSLLDAIRNKSVSTEIGSSLPRGLQVTTAYAWRFVVIAAAVGILIWLIIQLKLLVIPLLVAILITALLWPAFTWLIAHRVPRWLSIVIAVLGAVAVIGGLLWLAIWQISQQWGSVQARTGEAVGQFRQYLIDGPLHLTSAQIDAFLAQAGSFLQQQADSLWSGALAVGSTVGHVLTGVLLTLFILICILADGGGIWRWVVRLFPRPARENVDRASQAGWKTVINYARTQLLVATIDATGIALGAFLLGVPLAIPIGVLVFLGAFIPFVGAVVTGALAVFLALVYNGPWIALWMLVVVLAVQQLESHILQPLLMGSAVKVHPLAVVLVVAGGAMIAGIPGALFAVPLAAFINVVAVYLSHRHIDEQDGFGPADLIWSTVPRSRRNPA
ncbi:AI-2E family transporter [Microbacterium sp.]|uniref:AI-2E family transporter n=1 Tax=Microbacterium sp. TaxID=51671 RepID=UPI0025FBD3D0|nr:AI-2E family transporter [Microbacterium sp.]